MKGTILVAEDEGLSRKNVCHVLQEEGYQVHEACDGRAALEAIDKIDFDLVLTDLQMPGADGLAVLNRVREVAPQTFVLIMTAFATVDTSVAALQLGAQDYLLKPIVFEDLLRKIHKLMEHKDLAWENQMLRRESIRSPLCETCCDCRMSKTLIRPSKTMTKPRANSNAGCTAITSNSIVA